MCVEAQPFPYNLHSFIVHCAQIFLWDMNIREKMLYFGEGYISDCLDFQSCWERWSVNQVQSANKLLNQIGHLLAPISRDVEFMP